LRLAARAVQSAVRRREINLIPTLVVGRGREAALCVREMRARRELGYRVIGIVEAGAPTDDAPREFEGVPIVADLSTLPEAIRETGANEVIITDPAVPGDLLFDVMMRVGRRRGVEFRVAPSLFNSIPRKTEADQIGVLPVITLFREPLGPGARLLKRASDILVAGAALVLLAPLWLVLAALIKLDSRGPVLYAQERVGKNGRAFRVYKFRSMRTDAEKDGPVWASKSGDARTTRVGRVIRKIRVDEIPQFWNILRGEMNFVGPRPERPHFVRQLAEEIPFYDQRHLIAPGLTGWAQIKYPYGASIEDARQKLQYDLYYIKNQSLVLDAVIMFETVKTILFGRGA
ncbi:MAG: sugar transferase, partial [Acidobacteriota bacterium]|nr:sugar transferase [Acidobacteriota bacterium]